MSNYEGCYMDTWWQRAIPDPSIANKTVSECRDIAAAAGSTVFGIQYAFGDRGQCRHGKSLDGAKRFSRAYNCRAGSDGRMVGSDYSNAVYTVTAPNRSGQIAGGVQPTVANKCFYNPAGSQSLYEQPSWSTCGPERCNDSINVGDSVYFNSTGTIAGGGKVCTRQAPAPTPTSAPAPAPAAPVGRCYELITVEDGAFVNRPWQASVLANNAKTKESCLALNAGETKSNGKVYGIVDCNKMNFNYNNQSCFAWGEGNNLPTQPVIGTCYYNDGSVKTQTNFPKTSCDNLNNGDSRNPPCDQVTKRGCSSFNINTVVSPPAASRKRDCAYSEWSSANPCVCATNTRLETRTITQFELDGGVPCDYNSLSRSVPCECMAPTTEAAKTAFRQQIISEINKHRQSNPVQLAPNQNWAVLDANAERDRQNSAHYSFNNRIGYSGTGCDPQINCLQIADVQNGFVGINSLSALVTTVIDRFVGSSRHRPIMLNNDYTLAAPGFSFFTDSQGRPSAWINVDLFSAAPAQPVTPPCAYGAWTQTSPCNAACGQQGTRTETRTATNQPCTGTTTQTQTLACSGQPCPTNCSGNFSAWGSCDCSTSTRSRTFIVNTPAANGGTPCSFANGQVQTEACTPQGGGKNIYYATPGSSYWTLYGSNLPESTFNFAKSTWPSYCWVHQNTQPTNVCSLNTPSATPNTANVYYSGNGNTFWSQYLTNVPSSERDRLAAMYPDYCWKWQTTQPNERCTTASAPAPSAPSTANIYVASAGSSSWSLWENNVPESRLSNYTSQYPGYCWRWSTSQPSGQCTINTGGGLGSIFRASRGNTWSRFDDNRVSGDVAALRNQMPGFCWTWVANNATNGAPPATPSGAANC